MFVKTLAEALVKNGEEVWVAGFGKKGQMPVVLNGVRVHWIHLPNILYRKVLINGYPYSAASLVKRQFLSVALNNLHRREKFDLVETYDFSGPLAKKPSCKLVVRLHGSVTVYRLGEGRPAEIAPLDKKNEINQVRMADHVIAVSHHIGQATNEVMEINRPYTVIYNGVNTDFFKPADKPAGGKQILFVGNMMWRKGVIDLIQAFPLVLDKHPDALLTLAGGSGGVHQTRMEAELEALPPEVKGRVQLVGKVHYESLPELYNQSAVFVFPSRVEAFGLTCAEAMACGCPVVATSLASGPELVTDGVSGLLADPREPKDLAEKVCRMLDDPAQARLFGIAARQKAEEHFNLKNLVEKNLEFYKSVISKNV